MLRMNNHSKILIIGYNKYKSKIFIYLYRNGASNVQKILIGNKIDLTSKRVIS
jgi:hypothetical protein